MTEAGDEQVEREVGAAIAAAADGGAAMTAAVVLSVMLTPPYVRPVRTP